MIKVGIIGASGYTGGELLHLLANHPQAEVCYITSERAAGQDAGELFPGLYRYNRLKFTPLDEKELPALDIFFLCLPHGKSMAVAKELIKSPVRIVDFSADFRLRAVAEFEKWYNQPHLAPELCNNAVYGLTEIFREQIRTAKLVANPGCYPTSVLLPLIPLLRAGLDISPDIIVDSKSGVSGAGRNPGLNGIFAEANENFSAYKIARSHRHLPEIEEKLNLFASKQIRVTFSPHLLPVNRGILSTIYLSFSNPASDSRITEILELAYQDEPFVRICKPGELPQLTQVQRSNRCDIGIHMYNNGKNAILISCIDNLVKGASGQAIQNMNSLFNLPESTGLPIEGEIV
ncbi:N-acetyl-gamma-glutamyl-phosphate reductase [candidate division KSB1 bacterium]|nr:N-acetyl-gamma-glutamyl-phosphate reductase [candidate division KSB1 bacterium]